MTGAVALLESLAFDTRNTAKVGFQPHSVRIFETILTNPSQSYQLHQTRICTDIHHLSSASIATRHDALQRIRKSRPGPDPVVPARRQRLQRDPTHQAPNPRLRPRRQPRRPPRLDLRKTPRLDRQLPLDLRRDPHLGVNILVLDRRPRRQHAHLLRNRPRAGRRPRGHRKVHPARTTRPRVVPARSVSPAQDLG